MTFARKKKQPRIPREVPGKATEGKPGWSEEHLRWIRKQPCLVTGHTPCDAHHLLKVPSNLGAGRGMGLRNADIFAVPLDHWQAHMPLHDNGNAHETEWFAERGVVDPVASALGLAVMSPVKEIRDLAKELIQIYYRSNP